MRDLEKYYGVKISKRMTLARMLSRSKRYKAKQTADRLLREVNALFVRGMYDQCLSILVHAVRLAPNDPRPFYTLGLIHEELGNAEKAQTSFFVCALLKRSDTAMWRKVLSAAAMTNDSRGQAMALEKICRREPNEALLVRKMECLKRLNKRFWVISCEIELFDYRGVDDSIFSRFHSINHLITIRRICNRLVRCIHRNKDAQSEYFVRNTIYNLYKLRDWKAIVQLLDEFYLNIVENPVPEIRVINYMARAQIRSKNDVKEGVSSGGGSCQGPDSSDSLPENLEGILGSCIRDLNFLGDEIPELSGLNKDFPPSARESDSLISVEYSTDRGQCSGSSDVESQVNALEIECFVSDERFWEGLSELKYINDLADFLQGSGHNDWGIRLLARLYLRAPDIPTKIKIADFFLHGGDTEMALKNYGEALEEDPTNMRIKSNLYEIYSKMGNTELAKTFEIGMQTYQYAVSAAGEIKKNYRYTSDKCRDMRAIYSASNGVLLSDFKRYPESTEALLDDFFSNAFVIVKNKNFKCFLNKYERVEREKGIVPRGEALSRREMAEKLVRISSLHGLDTEEWFYVIKNNIVCMIHCDRYREAKRLVLKSLEAHVLKDLCYTLPLSLLGIKIALRLNDFETVTRIIKGLAVALNYSVSYFLYFLCNFVPDFYHYGCFNSFQKNVQRVGRRSMSMTRPSDSEQREDTADSHVSPPQTEHGEESRAEDDSTCETQEPRTRLQNHGIVVENSRTAETGQKTAHNKLISRMPANREEKITPFLIVNSYIPRYLFTETVDDLAPLGQNGREEVVTILSSIHLAHSKSRVLVDRMKYAKAGIKMLHGIGGDSLFKTYNLAKAYHFYGCYPKAETYYLQVMDGDNEELRRMSAFNLSLIFKKNKSKKVLHHLLSKIK